jgi:carboxymethylenebutenolidase
MGQDITLTTKDGVTIGAYLATPTGQPKGGMVVLQEIFGVNHHIRAVADRYAAEGYLAIAPALFDRVERDMQVGYQSADMQRGMEVRAKTRLEETLLDIEAAIARVADAGKVGIVGYCWGGSLVYAATARLSGLSAGVGYYGGMIAGMLEETPQVPVILHFGALDKHIPLSDVDRIKAAKPDIPVYVYDADHGFNCDERGSYDKAAADLARERTLAFFAAHL